MRVARNNAGEVVVVFNDDEQEIIVDTVTHLIESGHFLGKDTRELEGWLVRYIDNSMTLH